MEDNITPAMRQYFEMKDSCPDAILFFRMGDFYEMFGEDAQIAHNILWIALTTRNKNAKEPIALAGIPYHAKDKYLPKLVQAGYKVAISEQVSDPKLKWIVKREIVRIITPSTLHLEIEDESEVKNNFILSIIAWEYWTYAMSSINVSNNTWSTSEFLTFSELEKQLYKIFPLEVILEKALYENEKIKDLLSKKFGLNIYFFQPQKKPKENLLEHFQVKNLEWFWIEHKLLAQKASSLILEYLRSVQKDDMKFLHTLRYESFSWFVDIDEATIRSLDILYNFFTKSGREGTLFWVLAKTKTPMGTRFLRDALVTPLLDIKQIEKRQQIIGEFLKDKVLLERIQNELKMIADIDTLLTRLALGRANPRDMLSLKRSLRAIVSIRNLIEQSQNTKLKELFDIHT